MFKEYKRKNKYEDDNEVIIAFRRRPDLLEEIITQLKRVEEKTK